jgi:Tfp pilus assembly protein PilX
MMLTRRDLRDDRGVAMLTVIMVAAVLMALGMAAVMVSTTNIRNAGRDRFATTAQGAAEAAVASAEAYLQTVSGMALACSPSCGATNPWGDSTTKKSLSFPGGRTAKVWIEVKQQYNPPTYKSADYVIHAVGKNSNAIATRTIDQEVSVQPLDFPFGVYVDNKINDQGTPSITNESVFSRTCIDSRNKIYFGGVDPFYGIPAAAHSAQYITNANQSSCDTNLVHEETTDNKAIHYDNTGGSAHNYCAPTTTGGTAVDTRYDQDALGGPFSQDTVDGTTCSSAPNQYTSTSYFDNNILTNQFNFQPKGLTESQYAALKSVAQAQGTYYTSASSIVWPTASAIPNAVMYFDLSSGQSVNVGSGDVASYAWVDEPGGTCNTQHPSIIIIVRGGDLTLGSGVSTTGAIFVPEGQLTAAGSVNLVGTIFAAYAKITGGANVSLNNCYIKNIPGPIMNVQPIRYHEVDR